MGKRPFKKSDDSRRSPFRKRREDSGKSFGERKGRPSFGGDSDRPKTGGRFKKSGSSFSGAGGFKRSSRREDDKGGPFRKSGRPFSDRKEGSGDRFKKSGSDFSPRSGGFKRAPRRDEEGTFRKSGRPFSDRKEGSGDRFKKSGGDYTPRSGAFKRAPRGEGDAESGSFRKSGRPFSERKSGGSFARPGGFKKREDRDDKGSFKRPGRPFSEKPGRFSKGRGEGSTFRKRDSDSDADRPKRFSKERSEGSFSKRPRKVEGFDRERDVKKIHPKEKKTFVASRLEKQNMPKQPDYEAKPKAEGEGELIRLNKFMANSGVGSRRQADEYIAMGLVTVNGVVVTEMGHKVRPTDDVRYEGKRLKAEKPVYILLNKPKGFITTTDDPQDRNTVMNLIANACKERVYPVGRLDRNTTGLLLLTNDGDVADKLTHPSYNVKKIYKVELDKAITKNDLQKIAEEGVYLEEGRAKVDDIAVVSDDYKTLGVELHIGWNRIVRRIFESLGYEVVKLDRVAYAGLDKKDLGRGEWRFLKPEEVLRLKHFK